MEKIEDALDYLLYYGMIGDWGYIIDNKKVNIPRTKEEEQESQQGNVMIEKMDLNRRYFSEYMNSKIYVDVFRPRNHVKEK